jgi:DNA-directed RNA polymerase sigma subunit (sigma70/sigma32)
MSAQEEDELEETSQPSQEADKEEPGPPEEEEPEAPEKEVLLPIREQPADSALQIYLAQAGEVPLLKAEEEKELSSQIEEGKYLARVKDKWKERHHRAASAICLRLHRSRL